MGVNLSFRVDSVRSNKRPTYKAWVYSLVLMRKHHLCVRIALNNTDKEKRDGLTFLPPSTGKAQVWSESQFHSHVSLIFFYKTDPPHIINIGLLVFWKYNFDLILDSMMNEWSLRIAFITFVIYYGRIHLPCVRAFTIHVHHLNVIALFWFSPFSRACMPLCKGMYTRWDNILTQYNTA